MNTKAKTSLAAMAVLAVLGLGTAGTAQAHGGVYWSVNMMSPGVSLGFSTAPVVAAPPVTYVLSPVAYPAPVPVDYGYSAYRHPPRWGQEREWGRYERYERYEGRGRRWRDDDRD